MVVARSWVSVTSPDCDTAKRPDFITPALCEALDGSSCLLALTREGVETILLGIPSDSAVAEMCLSRGGGVSAAGTKFDKRELTEELLESRLGPLVMRDEEEEEGVVLCELVDARVGVPRPRPSCIEALVRNLVGSGGRLAADVAGLATS